MKKKTYIIEKKKLLHNINIIKSKIKVEIIAVLKCDAYGLGLINFAKILIKNNINIFAITEIEDIINLRNNYFENKILFLNQTEIYDELKILIEKKVILTIGSLKAALVANKLAYKLNTKINAYIKIDIGMGRYGFSIDDIHTIKKTIYDNKNINFIGVYSHFSTAFYIKNDIFIQQIKYLKLFISKLNLNNIFINNLSIANSFIALNMDSLHYSCVRIGSAFLGKTHCDYKLKEIGYLKTYVHAIKYLSIGKTVGYGAIYRTKTNIKIAILAVGYYDGFSIIKDNIYPNKIKYLIYQILKIIKNFIFEKKYFVYISGKKYPIIGKIGMCHSMIDITNSNVNINSNVIVPISPLRINPEIYKKYV